MFSQSNDEQQGWVLGLVVGLVVLVLALVLGVAVSHINAAGLVSSPISPSRPAVAPPAVAATLPATPGPTLLTAQAAADAASITVEYGVVKFYFASGRAELAAGAGDVLVDVVKGARGGKKVVISGFHDAKGQVGRNAELARQRAQAVREALLAAGVADSQIRLEQAAQTAGTGSDAEARRVEISLQ